MKVYVKHFKPNPMIEELITQLAQVVNSQNGRIYTNTNLRFNPDVCHAACIWFQHVLAENPIEEAVNKLAQLDKNTLFVSQKEATANPKIIHETIKNARDKGYLTDGDIEALTYLYNNWKQPDAYSDNTNEVAQGLVASITNTEPNKLLFMISNKDENHVICISNKSGEIIIYDPNIGVIVLSENDLNTATGLIVMILQWYAREMKLNQFAFN